MIRNPKRGIIIEGRRQLWTKTMERLVEAFGSNVLHVSSLSLSLSADRMGRRREATKDIGEMKKKKRKSLWSPAIVAC